MTINAKNLARIGLIFLATAAVYFLMAHFGLKLATINSKASPIWPATGVGILFLFLFGVRYWPAVTVAAFLANHLSGSGILPNLLIACGNSLEAVLGAATLLYFDSKRDAEGNRSEILATAIASILCPVVSAIFGNTALLYAGIVPFQQFWVSFSTWWIGDVLGALLFIPFVFARDQYSRNNFSKTFAQLFLGFRLPSLGIIAALSAYVFYNAAANNFVFLLIPLLLIAFLLYGRTYLLLSGLLIAGIAVWATVSLKGPFVSGSLNENLIHLHSFLAVMALTVVILPSILNIRNRRIPAFTLILSWCIAGSVFYGFRKDELDKDSIHFKSLIESNHLNIKSKMVAYEEAVQSAASMLTITRDIRRDQWKTFIQSSDIKNRYPGIKGIGVVYAVPANKIQQFEQSMRTKQLPDFKIHAVQAKDVDDLKNGQDHFIITFVEPEESNKAAIGLDVSREAHRRDAALLSRATNLPTISKRITLVQDQSSGPGFLLFQPFRYNADHKDPPAQGNQYSEGWIYAPFTSKSFFSPVITETNEIVADVFDADDHLLEFSNKKDSSGLVYGANRYEESSTLRIGQRNFLFGWTRSPHFVSSSDTVAAWVGFWGAIITLLFGGLVSILASVREKAEALAAEKTKQIESTHERLVQSERRAKYALEGAKDAIWDWDLVKGEMYLSEEWAKSMDLPNQLPVSTTDDMKSMVHPDDWQANSFSILRHLQGETQKHESQMRLKTKSGEWKWFLTRGKVSERDEAGKPLRMTGTYIDISRLKTVEDDLTKARLEVEDVNQVLKRHESMLQAKNEELTSAMAAKSQFLAMMSHEIRTPLNGVMGVTDLLSETSLSHEQSNFVRLIQGSGAALMNIINDILDFSKVDAGKIEFERIPFDVSEMVADQIDLISSRVKEKGLVITTEIAPSLRTIRMGDPGRIGQILTNFLSNAMKFTDKGEVRLKVYDTDSRDKKLNPTHNRLRIEVIDTGIGLSEAQIAKMFNAFTQADSSTSRKYGGTGLGLSICKKLAEGMNGEVGVQSVLHEGSTFWLELPLDVVDSGKETTAPSTSAPSSSRPSAKEGRSGRILVAEDNSVNQFVISKQLEDLGYTFHIVANGLEVIEALKVIPYDLILMDCQMPEMDGFEATRLIRENKGTLYSKIPIIALTANAMDGDERKCIEAGMSDYLSKPVKKAVLSEKLNTWVSSGRSAQAAWNRVI